MYVCCITYEKGESPDTWKNDVVNEK